MRQTGDVNRHAKVLRHTKDSKPFPMEYGTKETSQRIRRRRTTPRIMKIVTEIGEKTYSNLKRTSFLTMPETGD